MDDAQGTPDLPALPPRPSSGPSQAAKSMPPPLPHRPDLGPKENENNVEVGNKNSSLERPPRNKAKGRPEITIVSAQPMGTSSAIPQPVESSGMYVPPLPSRPPLTTPTVPQLPSRPPVDPPQLPATPPLEIPPLPARPPADTPMLPERPPVNPPKPPERPPADTEPRKSGPPPRPKSTPVSTTGEIEQNGLPPLPKRDFPETFPAAIESTTHEKSPEQPQAPPRRPKRGPTVIKAPLKPVENEPQKTEGNKLTAEKLNKPADVRQTKEVSKTNSIPQVAPPTVPVFAVKTFTTAAAAKPKEMWQPPQQPSKILKDPKETCKKDQNSISFSLPEKEILEQTKKTTTSSSKGSVFAPLPTGQVRGLVLKKLSQDIATLKENQTKPVDTTESQKEMETDMGIDPQKEESQPIPKLKPRPTIISAKRPEKGQPCVGENHGNDLSSKQDTQASLETVTPKPRSTLIKAKLQERTENEETSPLTNETVSQAKTDSIPSPPSMKSRPTIITAKTKPSCQSENVKESGDNVGSPTDEKAKPEVVPLKPKSKPTIIVAKPPKPTKQVKPDEDKSTSGTKELETENTEKDVSSKNNAEKQDTQPLGVSKPKPKPTIIRAVKPPEKPAEQNSGERKEERKTTETSSKSNELASSPQPQRTKPKPTIIYAAKPPTEKRAAPPRPTRTPSVKTKPNNGRQQVQPKVETVRDPPRKKKPVLPFSTFYVDFDEPAEVVKTKASSAPKTKDKTQNKVPQNRAPPPPRPGSVKGASSKAPEKADEHKVSSGDQSDTAKTENQSTSNDKNLELKHAPALTEPAVENAVMRKPKPRPPRPYSIAIGESASKPNAPAAPEEKKTKPRPPRPRFLHAEAKTTEPKTEVEVRLEKQQEEGTAKVKTKPETKETPDTVAHVEAVKKEEISHPSDETPLDSTTIEKPKPSRPAPATAGETKPRPARPAPSISRQDRETSAKDKNRAGNPSKESVPEPAPTQVSSVCPTKIDPVAVALHDYQPTSADDLAFQAGAEILLLKRIDTQWLYGKCGQEEGMFPQSFVEIIEDLPVESQTQDQKSNAAKEDKSSSKVTALYDFQGSDSDGELSFKEGDIIDVMARVSDEWLKGSYRGQTGIFPSNFVDCTKLQISFTESAENVKSNNKTQELGTQERTADISSGPRCRALHDYHSDSPDDLSFVAGDIIRLTERVNGEWLRGETAGRRGMFPAAFVEIIEDIVVSQQPKQETALWHAIALHDFMSNSPGDLQFAAGSKIAVIEIVSEEWLKGRLDGEEGIFPTAFVEKQEDESVLKPQSLSTNVADTAKVENKSLRKTAKIPDDFTPKAKALYDFEGETEDEISFKAGDIVCLLGKVSDEWLSGELDNKVGRFPAAFVEILVPLP